MNKRLLIVTLAIGLATHVSGCSSSGSKENGDVAVSNDETFAEEGQGDFAENGGDKSAEGSTDSSGSLSDELGELNAENSGDKVAEEPKPEGGDDLAIKDNANQSSQDELSLDEGGDIGTEPKPDVAQQAPGAAETPNGDTSTLGANEPPKAEPPPTDEPLFGGEQPPPVADITEPPPIASNTDPSAPLDTSAPPIEPPAAEPPPPESVPVPAPVAKTFAPLQKVKDQPFTKNGTLLNRVYVGRSGDTTKSVAKKIYGEKSRSKDLVKWNPILSRGVKTGDKIYYSSPHDPADSARMLTFYEDNNIPPSVYVSKEGDNIRKISKDFLGSSDSWKEVWATNPNVESKGAIPPGLEIRYWPEGAAASALASTQPPTPVQPSTNPEAIAPPPTDPQAAFPQEQAAMQQPPPPQPPPDMPPPDMGQPPPPQPPPQEIAQVPPPPPPQPPPSSGSVNAQGHDPLAPPTDPNMHESPPAETKPVVKKTSPAVAEGEGTDTDTLISMAAGGILLVTAAVLLVVVRRNRAKKQAQAGMMGLGGDLGQTQV